MNLRRGPLVASNCSEGEIICIRWGRAPLAFFGFCDIVNGWLVFKSTFLPRWLGVMWKVGALGWTTYVYPPLGGRLFLPLVLYAMTSAAVFIGWLLIKGVDEKQWREVAARA